MKKFKLKFLMVRLFLLVIVIPSVLVSRLPPTRQLGERVS